MKAGVRVPLCVVALAMAAQARADRQELYTTLSYGPGVSHFSLPIKGLGPDITTFSNTLDVATYYGLTNALHLGARVRASRATDVRFAGTTVPMQDGSQSSGDVYMDHWSLGLGALVLYRIDTKAPFAPVLELEGGVTTHQYRRIVHIPSGVTYTLQQSDVSEAELYGSVAALLEYRFVTRWVATAGVSAQAEGGGHMPWALSFPLRLGVIW